MSFNESNKVETIEPAPASATETPPAESNGVASVSKVLVEKSPDVSEHVLAAAERPATSEPLGPVDKHGRTFDPELHVVIDGKPKISLRGKLCIKAGNRKATAAPQPNNTGSKVNIKGQESQGLTGALADVSNSEQAGKTLSNMYIMFWAWQVGPKAGAPSSPEEKKMLDDAFIRQCEESEIENVPPWLELITACTMYGLPRVQEPVMKTKFQKLKTRFQIWGLERRLKKQEITVKDYEAKKAALTGQPVKGDK